MTDEELAQIRERIEGNLAVLKAAGVGVDPSTVTGYRLLTALEQARGDLSQCKEYLKAALERETILVRNSAELFTRTTTLLIKAREQRDAAQAERDYWKRRVEWLAKQD